MAFFKNLAALTKASMALAQGYWKHFSSPAASVPAENTQTLRELTMGNITKFPTAQDPLIVFKDHKGSRTLTTDAAGTTIEQFTRAAHYRQAALGDRARLEVSRDKSSTLSVGSHSLRVKTLE